MKEYYEYTDLVRNINFDTTSKVMWGQYETAEGKMGVVKDEILTNLKVCRDDFNVAKAAIDEAANKLDSFDSVELINAKGQIVKYRLLE